MDVLEKIAKACSDVFALWNLNLNFFLLLDGFLKSFHAQADLAIFDTDDFDLNFITYIQDIFWEFDTLLADLGNVYKSVESLQNYGPESPSSRRTNAP